MTSEPQTDFCSQGEARIWKDQFLSKQHKIDGNDLLEKGAKWKELSNATLPGPVPDSGDSEEEDQNSEVQKRATGQNQKSARTIEKSPTFWLIQK